MFDPIIVGDGSTAPVQASQSVSLTPAPLTRSTTLSLTGPALPPSVTYARASTATYRVGGIVTTAPAHAPRFDFEPQGRQNLVRNSTMTGAQLGNFTPPGWTINSGGGVTWAIVDRGTEAGLPYIDIRWTGTPATNTNIGFFPDNTMQQAFQGMSFTNTIWMKLVAGTLPANALQVYHEIDATQSNALTYGTSVFTLSSSLSLYTMKRTIAQAGTCFTRYYTQIPCVSGVPVDLTIRVAAPQLEQGNTATAFIATTGVSTIEPSSPPALLVEPSRTNIFPRSNEWPFGYNPSNASTIVYNAALAPDGSNTAARLTLNGVANFGSGYGGVVTGDQVVTSFYIKNVSFAGRIQVYTGDGASTGGRAAQIVLSGSNVSIHSSDTQSTAIDQGNGWWRVVMPYLANANVGNGNLTLSAPGNVGLGGAFLLFGRQCERGTYATSYIPTVTVPVTRAADSVTVDWTGRAAAKTQPVTVTFEDGSTQVIQAGDATLPALNRLKVLQLSA